MARGNNITANTVPIKERGPLQVVRLDPEVHRRMRIHAVHRNMTLKDLVSQAVDEWLARNERRAA